MEELQKQIEFLQKEIVETKKQVRELTEKKDKNIFSNIEIFDTPVRIVSQISAQAGGKAGLYIGSGPFGIYYGSGAPTISASKGSLYLRTDGSSTSTRAYINTDAGTTWTAVTTAA